MLTTRPHRIACFGEALWDVLPRGIFLGGAPLNVAYHLSRHDVDARPISAVGEDFLGEELLRRVGAWGVNTRCMARARSRPTGTVRAIVDANGNASYRIARDVAWDRISVLPALEGRPAPSAIVYGTLALREEPNRRALDELLAAWPEALRVLDLNLRPPFSRPSVVGFALGRAQLLKLNDHELAQLTRTEVRRIDLLEAAARRLSHRHHIARVCVSAGARGAGLLWHGTWYWEPARAVEVRDTIGAGDAFLAAFLAALLSRRSPQDALAAACRMGEFVASSDGATPAYTIDARGRIVA